MKNIIANINKKIDAQKLFGLTMFINYVVYFFIFDYNSENAIISITLRTIASVLCLPLIFIKYENNIFYKRIYWRVVLAYCLPFFFTFMSLINNLSTIWLMNSISATFFMIILLELKLFYILFSIGITTAIILYKYILNFTITIKPGDIDLYDILATYIAVVIIGSLFAFNRESIESERKKNSEKVQKLNDSLEQKVKVRTLELEKALSAKTEFLNNMSHEIRTPIQGFTSLSEGLVEHWKNFSESKKINIAQQVSSSAKRLASLVGGLLDLSKFNANKMIMDFNEMDLNEDIQNMISECNDLYLNEKNIQIYFNNPSKTIIQGDKNRLTQVLRNLFANAIKFTPDEGTINISLKNTKLNDKAAIHFTIKDSGIGIPPKEMDSIFTPFTQSSLTKTKAGGTGLGLSICKQIITSHNGKIWAENNEDIGASLHFIIPISQSSEDKTSQNTSSLTSANILMIDDEDICLSSMELLILNTPYTFIKTDGGISGLDYIKQNYNNIDVILLDLMMPDIYGLTILEEIKKDPKLAKIPVILQSGTSDQIEIQKAYHMGIVSFISKPYKKDIVLKAIENAIKENRP